MFCIFSVDFDAVQSLSCVDSLWPHELQHTRVPCPSLSPRVCSNSCPLTWWCYNHLILWHPLLLLPSLFPRVRVFSNELALCIRWLKYWSFSLSISPSNEYSELIPLGLTGLISLLSKGLFSSTTIWKHQFFGTQASLWSNSHICTWLLEKLYLWLYGPLSAKWCFCLDSFC